MTFRRETIAPMALIAVSTGLLIYYDGPLYDETVRAGDHMGIPQENRQLEYGKFILPGLDAQVAVFTVPGNMGAWLYFLGNGWFYVGLIGSFWGYGMVADDQNAVNTAADITEAMTINGAVVLALKMSTGRETPNTRETPSGKWRWFRNPWQYLGHVSKYDAFPSGHLATAMAAATVVGDHYPDQKWIYPLSYAMMVPLTFQMVNSGVHWYSDYPLAIYIGSTVGKVVVGRRGLGKGRSALLPEVTPVAIGDASGVLLTWPLR
jgi:membrane-associated phospholipid phosphatase